MEDGEDQILDLNGEFALANAECALELRERNVVAGAAPAHGGDGSGIRRTCEDI